MPLAEVIAHTELLFVPDGARAIAEVPRTNDLDGLGHFRAGCPEKEDGVLRGGHAERTISSRLIVRVLVLDRAGLRHDVFVAPGRIDIEQAVRASRQWPGDTLEALLFPFPFAQQVRCDALSFAMHAVAPVAEHGVELLLGHGRELLAPRRELLVDPRLGQRRARVTRFRIGTA